MLCSENGWAERTQSLDFHGQVCLKRWTVEKIRDQNFRMLGESALLLGSSNVLGLISRNSDDQESDKRNSV